VQRSPIRQEWPPEVVGRLWNHIGADPTSQQEYFSAHVGHGLVELLRRFGALPGPGGRALDYGCGPGYLVERLLEANVPTQGADGSEESVAALNERLAGRPLWLGAVHAPVPPLPVPDGSFDLVTCIETLEHLDDPTLDAVLRELRRLTTNGGRVFVTTPNEEELAANVSYCPFCDTTFHRYGHLRRFDAVSLAGALQRNGLRPIECRSVNLHRYQDVAHPERVGWLDTSPRTVGRAVRRRLRRGLDGPGPHLVAIATPA
jgi:SAM-dependent methyltransferase